MSNLLPQTEKGAIVRMYRKRFVGVALLTLAALLVAASLLTLPSFLLLKSNELVLKEQRDRLAGYETSTIARNLSDAVRDVNSRLSVFPVSETASPLIADFMNPVLLAKSNSIHIIGFTYAPNDKQPGKAQVKITGTADSRVSLLAFAERLKKAGSFSDVNVPITNFIKDSDVPFTVTATVSLK